MKQLLFLKLSAFGMLACLCVSFLSCSKDDDLSNDVSGLSSLDGHKVDFYYESGGKLYHTISINVTKEGEFNAFCYDAKQMLGGDEFTYEQTSENKAHLEMLINYFTAAIKDDFDYVHTYKLDLTFALNNQGYAEGRHYFTMLYNGSITKVFKELKLYFIVDSSELPNKEAIDKAWNGESDKEDDGEDVPGGKVVFSSPVITEITQKSALVKGTILGDGVEFEERGVCYSTTAAPTVNDKKIRSNADIIQASLTDLFVGTVYHVRLYAKVKGVVTYGKEVLFTTDGLQVQKVALKAAYIGFDTIMLQATLPNEVTSYGLCYGTSPHPIVTDFTTTEGTRRTSWKLTGLKKGTTYYIRAYHKNGTKFEYYDDEISVKTTGGSDFTSTITDSNRVIYGGGHQWKCDLNISYNVEPKGLYKVTLETFPLGTFSDEIYVNNGTGDSTLKIENFSLGTFYNVRLCFTNTETGVMYKCGEIRLYRGY